MYQSSIFKYLKGFITCKKPNFRFKKAIAKSHAAHPFWMYFLTCAINRHICLNPFISISVCNSYYILWPNCPMTVRFQGKKSPCSMC